MALDIGTRWIGVAVSDPTQTLARPETTIERTNWKRTLELLRDILGQFDAVGVVVGLPYNMDGSESDMSRETRNVVRKLRASLDLPVMMIDERVSSFEARRRLWDRGVTPENTKPLVDQEAAAVILEDFMAGRESS